MSVPGKNHLATEPRSRAFFYGCLGALYWMCASGAVDAGTFQRKAMKIAREVDETAGLPDIAEQGSEAVEEYIMEEGVNGGTTVYDHMLASGGAADQGMICSYFICSDFQGMDEDSLAMMAIARLVDAVRNPSGVAELIQNA